MKTPVGRHRSALFSISGLLAAFLLVSAGPLEANEVTPVAYPIPDVHFVPTPDSVVKKMLEMARTGPDDIVYDLGSGDGRIVITAARDFGVRKAVGVDIDSEMVKLATANAKATGVGDRTQFFEGNLFDYDFSEATVVTIYLLPSLNIRLRPRILEELRPGTRVVSHQFDMQDWIQDEFARHHEMDIYMWIVPAPIQGTWEWRQGRDRYRIDLEQQFQKVSGTLHATGQATPITAARLSGAHLRFEATALRDGRDVPVRFDGRAWDGVISGVIDMGGTPERVVLKRIN